MNQYVTKLTGNELIQNLNSEEVDFLFEPDSCIVGKYKKNTLITQVGDLCTSIGFILEGELAIQQLTPCGGLVNFQTINAKDTIGTVQLLSDEPVYPYSLVTLTETTIVYVTASKVKELLDKSLVFNRNYIKVLSNRFRLFNDKIMILSHKDVRSRLMLYLSTESLHMNSSFFQLRHSKTEIADMIGVARPSVSRELKHMQEDELIRLEGNKITLLTSDLFTT